MKYLKDFENKDVLEEFDLWDINYLVYKDEKLIKLDFKYYDRIDEYEIDTINKILPKLTNIKTVRIVSGYEDEKKLFITKELFNRLKIPNNMKVITGSYKLMIESYPEIKDYFDNLFKNIQTEDKKNMTFYYKDNIKLMIQDKNEIICSNDLIWNKFQVEKIKPGHLLNNVEISYILKDMLKEYFNMNLYPIDSKDRIFDWYFLS